MLYLGSGLRSHLFVLGKAVYTFGSSARRDLCGMRRVTGASTVTVKCLANLGGS